MGDEEVASIVIDHGSGECKTGFIAEDGSCTAFPSTIEVPQHQGVMVGKGPIKGKPRSFAGDDPQSHTDAGDEPRDSGPPSESLTPTTPPNN